MADAFRGGGGKVDFRVLPAFGSEGHWLAGDRERREAGRRRLDGALKCTAVAKLDERRARRPSGPMTT